MQNPTGSDSRSPPTMGGVVTRAQTGVQNDTAQPALTSGFGTVIEKEYDLQAATESALGPAGGHRSTDVDAILRKQHSQLGAHIALLEQRYEALPHPEGVPLRRERCGPRKPSCEHADLMAEIIAQHTSLIADIEALIGGGVDGQRGELILTEVSRNHKEMLTALLNVTRHR